MTQTGMINLHPIKIYDLVIHGITTGGLHLTYGNLGGGQSGDSVTLRLPGQQAEALHRRMAGDGWVFVRDGFSIEVNSRAT